jgi:hypothetical protein
MPPLKAFIEAYYRVRISAVPMPFGMASTRAHYLHLRGFKYTAFTLDYPHCPRFPLE